MAATPPRIYCLVASSYNEASNVNFLHDGFGQTVKDIRQNLLPSLFEIERRISSVVSRELVIVVGRSQKGQVQSNDSMIPFRHFRLTKYKGRSTRLESSARLELRF